MKWAEIKREPASPQTRSSPDEEAEDCDDKHSNYYSTHKED